LTSHRFARCPTLSFLRRVTSHLRAARLLFESERCCTCQPSRGAARHIVALVTTRLGRMYAGRGLNVYDFLDRNQKWSAPAAAAKRTRCRWLGPASCFRSDPPERQKPGGPAKSRRFLFVRPATWLFRNALEKESGLPLVHFLRACSFPQKWGRALARMYAELGVN
jgi:hypothetical protein